VKDPPCVDDREHEWRRPQLVVGGSHSDPGVMYLRKGEYARTYEVCARCARYRVTTLARDSGTGWPGTVEHQEPDEVSIAWAEEQKGGS
jgi:hypothetical protein